MGLCHDNVQVSKKDEVCGKHNQAQYCNSCTFFTFSKKKNLGLKFYIGFTHDNQELTKQDGVGSMHNQT